MNDEQQGPRIPHDGPEEMPDTAVSSAAAGTGGMANAMPPAMPGAPAPLAPPPPAPTQIGTRMGTPSGMGGVRGVTAPGTTAEGAVATAGQDIRHRGWYWHWNTLITQYAPLLGLKGVGLLNSYTVWTDRREGSPHQGYAFPTQDAEGKFYGEGREELITLNKILVALDLIEIHKEMVLRQDDRNRRWRVPHNFYRVKDPRDGLVLNLPAVVRVLELANRDRNVFRHVRHIFGAQFAPIDRTSIWHYLLPELRQFPLWQQLAERAERERRGGKKIVPLIAAEEPATIDATDTTIPQISDIGTPSIADTEEEEAVTTDKGQIIGDDFGARTNGVPRVDAEIVPEPLDVMPSDAEVDSTYDEGMMRIELARPPFVWPADSMYHQGEETKEETSTSTTSTSTSASVRESVSDIFAALAERDRRERRGEPPPDDHDATTATDDPSRFLPEQPLPPAPALPEDGAVIVRALDVTDPTPNALAHQTASIVDIEAALTMANGRPPSDMEISLLVQVARECEPAAQSQGYGPGTGLGWVLAAIWEAVNSGSQFVAPKRIAAICDRWIIEGFGADNRANPSAPPVYTSPPNWPMPTMSGEPAAMPPPVTITDSAPLPEIGYTSVSSVATPGTAATEAEGRRLWEQVTHRLGGVLHPEALQRWFTDARVTAIEHDRVTVTVPGADVALKLASYRGLISRRMSETLGHTVDVVFQATHLSGAAPSAPASPAPPVQQSTQVYSSPSVTDAPSPWSWPGSPTASGALPTVPAEFGRAHPPEPSPTTKVESPRVDTPKGTPPDPPVPVPATPSESSGASPTTGLTNRQIWALALQDLQSRMSGATFAVWVRPAELLAIDPDGTLVIGARNRVQRERLEGQYLADLIAVLGAILDRPVGVRVVLIGDADIRSVG
ncbi:MAG: DnaA N-terminal domain-containing protein [Thermomicrobiales bacterium]